MSEVSVVLGGPLDSWEDGALTWSLASSSANQNFDDKPQKPKVERKKQVPQNYIRCDTIYVNFKKSQTVPYVVY